MSDNTLLIVALSALGVYITWQSIVATNKNTAAMNASLGVENSTALVRGTGGLPISAVGLSNSPLSVLTSAPALPNMTTLPAPIQANTLGSS